jgi:hypothetical protein
MLLGTHHGDGGVWNAWVCSACATRGTRREMGLLIGRNEELVNIYRQTPNKSPHEVSRPRRVLLGTSTQLCRNITEYFSEFLYVDFFEIRSECVGHILIGYLFEESFDVL